MRSKNILLPERASLACWSSVWRSCGEEGVREERNSFTFRRRTRFSSTIRSHSFRVSDGDKLFKSIDWVLLLGSSKSERKTRKIQTYWSFVQTMGVLKRLKTFSSLWGIRRPSSMNKNQSLFSILKEKVTRWAVLSLDNFLIRARAQEPPHSHATEPAY